MKLLNKQEVELNKATKASGTRLSKDEDFLIEVLGTKPGKTYNAAQILCH